MATYTASLLESNVKAVHTGVIAVGAHSNPSLTGTAGSIILLNTVPHGATLLDWWAHISTGAATAQTIKLGTSNTPSGIASLFSLTQTFSLSAGTAEVVLVAGIFNAQNYRAGMDDLMPVKISLSDDVQPSSVQLRATIGAAISASALFTWTLFYTMDGLAGHTTIR